MGKLEEIEIDIGRRGQGRNIYCGYEEELIKKVRRLREAIAKHKHEVWGTKVDHPADKELYKTAKKI